MFKYILLFFLLVAFVPSFRRFLFWLLVGRKIVNQQEPHQKVRKEGDVKVDNHNRQSTKNESGTYIDYEEVK